MVQCLCLSLENDIVEAFQMVFLEVLGGYEKIRFKGLDFESDHLLSKRRLDTFHHFRKWGNLL